MSSRHEKLGFKQTVQKVWMDKTVQMMLAGLSETEIRDELNDYLSTQKQSGGMGDRGQKTYGMAIALLASWFAPDKELRQFRDDALSLARSRPSVEWLPLHWAVMCASYPFFLNVARQVGRLLNLQDQVTQVQIFSRLKEQYGDRETVARNARYAVRSLIAWDVLDDTKSRGCYMKSDVLSIEDPQVAILLIESALLANPEAKSALGLILNNPAFFPFNLPSMTGDFVAKNCERIDVIRYGLDDELLKLKGS